MNDYLALSIIYVIFLFLSFAMYKSSLKASSWFFIVLCFVYFLGIYFYFEFFNQLHDYLRDNKIYIEFGHASLELILLMLFCYINGLALIMVILYKRWKLKEIQVKLS